MQQNFSFLVLCGLILPPSKYLASATTLMIFDFCYRYEGIKNYIYSSAQNNSIGNLVPWSVTTEKDNDKDNDNNKDKYIKKAPSNILLTFGTFD